MNTTLIFLMYVLTNICQKIFIMFRFAIHIISDYVEIDLKFHNYDDCWVLSDVKYIRSVQLIRAVDSNNDTHICVHWFPFYLEYRYIVLLFVCVCVCVCVGGLFFR